MIALAVSDFDLPRSLLAAGKLEVDYLETGGHFVERTVAQFPDRPLLLHNSVFNWSLAHPIALGVLFDTHEALLDEDYALLEWVLQRTQPLALTLEYNREEAELRAELERLRVVLDA